MNNTSDDNVDPEKIFQLNEKKRFKVLDIDLDTRKIALSLKSAEKAAEKTEKTEKAEKPVAKKKPASKPKTTKIDK
jgi:ribosomal protein S1